MTDVAPFLQLDFGRVRSLVSVVTLGRPDANWLVSSYRLKYSIDDTVWAWYFNWKKGRVKVRVFIFCVMFAA